MDAALWQFAASLAAVAGLVILARRLGFSGRPEPLDEEQARTLAAEVPGGFDAVRVTLDRAGTAALLHDAGGRIVLVVPAGAHFIVRLLSPTVRADAADGRLTVHDGSLAAALDLGVETEDWAMMLGALE
jgi:hypothetical protein